MHHYQQQQLFCPQTSAKAKLPFLGGLECSVISPPPPPAEQCLLSPETLGHFNRLNGSWFNGTSSNVSNFLPGSRTTQHNFAASSRQWLPPNHQWDRGEERAFHYPISNMLLYPTQYPKCPVARVAPAFIPDYCYDRKVNDRTLPFEIEKRNPLNAPSGRRCSSAFQPPKLQEPHQPPPFTQRLQRQATETISGVSTADSLFSFTETLPKWDKPPVFKKLPLLSQGIASACHSDLSSRLSGKSSSNVHKIAKKHAPCGDDILQIENKGDLHLDGSKEHPIRKNSKTSSTVSEIYKRRPDGLWVGLGIKQMDLPQRSLPDKQQNTKAIPEVELSLSRTIESASTIENLSVMKDVTQLTDTGGGTSDEYEQSLKPVELAAPEKDSTTPVELTKIKQLSFDANIYNRGSQTARSGAPKKLQRLTNRPVTSNRSATKLEFFPKRNNAFPVAADTAKVSANPPILPLLKLSANQRLRENRVVRGFKTARPCDEFSRNSETSVKSTSVSDEATQLKAIEPPHNVQKKQTFASKRLCGGLQSKTPMLHRKNVLLKNGSVTQREWKPRQIEIWDPRNLPFRPIKKDNQELLGFFAMLGNEGVKQKRRLVSNDRQLSKILFLNHDAVQKGEAISSGTFCTVHAGTLRNEKVAIKCPLAQQIATDPEMAVIRAVKELRLLSRASRHSNILKLFGTVAVSEQEIWILTELVSGGDLHARLHPAISPKEENNNVGIPPDGRLKIMEQLSSVLGYLHEMEPKIVHKDLKSNNILVDDFYDIRLCDFGDAEEIRSGESIRHYTAVTWQYAPPEIILSKDPSRPERYCNESVDIWSLGCILLELCYKPTPFWGILQGIDPAYHHVALQSYLHKILGGSTTRPHQFKGRIFRSRLPNCLSVLIEWCLRFDASFRPTAKQVHSYISQFRSNLLKELRELDESRHTKDKRSRFC